MITIDKNDVYFTMCEDNMAVNMGEKGRTAGNYGIIIIQTNKPAKDIEGPVKSENLKEGNLVIAFNSADSVDSVINELIDVKRGLRVKAYMDSWTDEQKDRFGDIKYEILLDLVEKVEIKLKENRIADSDKEVQA